MDRPIHYIDEFFVEFTTGQGWRCDCVEFAILGSCERTLQAAAMQTLERRAEEFGGSAERR